MSERSRDPWQIRQLPRTSSFAETDGPTFDYFPIGIVLVQIRGASPCQKDCHALVTCGRWEIMKLTRALNRLVVTASLPQVRTLALRTLCQPNGFIEGLGSLLSSCMTLQW